ncbi:hypothetical protein EV207_11846 [Scopulibacillus darangshiensis]|uniref:LSM domain-containing protein n=1 Tax=Scopulibacillus darangshiensis TaxID=442528 RepID=A0A4R2NZ96_9BACL|nr:hypothetical protein [Scopulibacillus darangshiensis]TCP27068.1 hypothetical protein EV207_11846 [Scopulibacillus darangshiensis]
MSAEHFYHQCCEHINNAVEITCHDGTVHRGIIHSVDRENVYLRPFDGFDGGGYDGPGIFAFGFPGAFAGGFTGGLLGVGLGSIFGFRRFGYGGFY